MHEALQSTADSQLFQATAAPYLLLDKDLRIQAANPAYLRATGRQPDELADVYLFDAFPDNPQDTTANGVHNLGMSLERVLRNGAPDDMGVQRYDIPDPRSGSFRHKTWSPINSPLTDTDRHVVGLLHHVEDITAVEDIVRAAVGGNLLDGPLQPAAVVRRAMLAAARSARALAAARNGMPVWTGSAARDTAQDIARRDALWHRIIHAARNADGGCAAAICLAATEELSGIDAAVITVSSGSLAQHQLAATGPWAQRAEELQLITGEGPSISAVESGWPALVPVLDATEAVWPAYVDAARGIGVAGVFAFPLRSATAILGTLTLYQRRSRGRSDVLADVLADGQRFAELAAPVLLADVSCELVDQISTTAAEDNVNVAIGMLAAAEHITTDDAHARPRAAAYHSGRRLVDVAREVLPAVGSSARPAVRGSAALASHNAEAVVRLRGRGSTGRRYPFPHDVSG